MSDAYLGTTIVGFQPTTAPNPACCSDPGVLCANCAAKALSRQGFTGNSEFVVNDEDDFDDDFDEDVLPTPGADTAPTKCGGCPHKERCAEGETTPCDTDLLIPPRLDFTGAAAPHRADADLLPPPSMTW